MARDFRIGAHTVRAVYDSHSRGGTFKPELHFHLTGPNGSPNGIGPKGWPRFLWRAFPYYDRRPGKWSSVLVLPLPHVSWRLGYRFRRLGGIRLSNACYRAMTRRAV